MIDREDKKKIFSVLESMLFVWGDPLEARDAAKVLDLKEKEVIEAFQELSKRYETEGRGITIRRVETAWQMTTSPGNSDYIQELCAPVKNKRLSQAAMEVLAIVAYEQPVTKAHIEAIRGVRCDRPIDGLIEKNFIKEEGRASTVGRPILYGTTEYFLGEFGFESIKDLPDADLAPEEKSEIESEIVLEQTELESV